MRLIHHLYLLQLCIVHLSFVHLSTKVTQTTFFIIQFSFITLNHIQFLDDYLILEDVTFNFNHPCILDIKIGQFLWNDFDSDDRKANKRKKYPNQESVGFSIIGMRVCGNQYPNNQNV